jgi:hypothetical protein
MNGSLKVPSKKWVKQQKAKRRIKRGWDGITAQLLIDIIKPVYGHNLAHRYMTIHDALNDYFNTDNREIYHVRFDQNLHLYGEHWLSTFTRSLETGPRTVKKGQTGLLRIDTGDCGHIDIQVRLQNETDQLFTLTAGQWNVIKKKVTIVYQSVLTGKEATRARHLKQYHAEFVRANLGCKFEYRTASGRIRPNYKGTKG